MLLVDIDPQGNATSGLGVDAMALGKTIYNALIVKESIASLTMNTAVNGLSWFLPTHTLPALRSNS